MKPTEVDESRFRTFVHEKNFLVADVNPRMLEFVFSVLESMGVTKKQLNASEDFEKARHQIQTLRPQIVLTDYDLNKKCGLGLLDVQRKFSTDSKNSFFILVTGNTSQMAVARAAEEEVDGYVLKPFTGFMLREALLKAAATRFEPSEYERMVEQAKDQISNLELDQATELLLKAKEKNPTPALALYYLGQIELLKKDFPKAQEKFQLGLKSHRIHRKCLLGLYESYMGQSEFGEAYSTLKKISHYFPLDSSHLSSMLKMAIQTKTYEDIERLFRIFESIEEKNDELVKYVCAALVVCGKYYLQKTFRSRSLELFQHAVKTANNNIKILKEVILILTEAQLKKEAELFFQFFPKTARDSTDFAIANLAVQDLTREASKVIELCEEVLKKGISDPILYQIYIRRLVQSPDLDKAKELSNEASQKWPSLKEKFEIPSNS